MCLMHERCERRAPAQGACIVKAWVRFTPARRCGLPCCGICSNSPHLRVAAVHKVHMCDAPTSKALNTM